MITSVSLMMFFHARIGFADMGERGRKMLYRNEDGKLWLDCLRFMPFIDGMFDQCKNLHELKWLEEEITDIVVGRREDFEERLEVKND